VSSPQNAECCGRQKRHHNRRSNRKRANKATGWVQVRSKYRNTSSSAQKSLHQSIAVAANVIKTVQQFTLILWT